MKIKIITPPTTEPVTLTEVKAHMRVDFSDDDTYITNLIETAREWCESFQNKAYITQTLEIALDTFPCNEIRLPRPPLTSVTSVKYYDLNDVEATVSTDDYYVDDYAKPGTINLNYNKYWPKTTLRPTNAVIVRYIAGGSAVSNKVKHAIMLLVNHWYENREVVSRVMALDKETKFAVTSLLSQDRVVLV